MDLPHRRTDDRHVRNENVLTSVWLDELRTEVVALAKSTLRNGYSLLRHRHETLPSRGVVGCARAPTVLSTPLPGPPVLEARLAVERALARNRDVLLLERIDQRRVSHQLRSLEPREHRREVVTRILTE